jgi:hypothetical protein
VAAGFSSTGATVGFSTCAAGVPQAARTKARLSTTESKKYNFEVFIFFLLISFEI